MRSGRAEARTDRSEGAERRNGVQRNDTATSEHARDRPTTTMDGAARDGVGNAPNERRAVRTLQETLGNRAIQALHRSGELDRFLRQEGPGPGTDRREGPSRETRTGPAQGGETRTPPGSTVAAESRGTPAAEATTTEARAKDPQTAEPTATELPTAERPAVGPAVEDPGIEEPGATEEPGGGTIVADTVNAAVHEPSPADESAASAGIEQTVPASREPTPLDVETPIAEAATERPGRTAIDVPVPATPVPGSSSDVAGPSGPVDTASHEREADAPVETESEATRPPTDRRTDEDRGPPATASTPAEPASTPDTGPSPTPGAGSRPGRPEAAEMAGEQPTSAASEEALDPAEAAGPASVREPVSQGGPGDADTRAGTAGAVPASRVALAAAGPARPPGAAGPSGGREAVPRPPSLSIQAKLTVGRSNDRFEREADAVAAAVTADRPPPAVSAVTSGGSSGLASWQLDEEGPIPGSSEELVQTRPTTGGPETGGVPASTASTIRSPGPGRPLPQGVRNRIEPRLGTTLAGVQVHAGTRAARAAGSLGARAFTHRNHVFLGNGESAHDLELMAHEATHVVQQGAVSGRRDGASPSADVQRFVPDWILEELSDYARYIPGWTLFTVIIGYNPLTGSDVERTPTNLVEGLLGLLPAFGPLIFDALQEYEVLPDAFEWVTGELDRLNLSLGRLEDTIEAAWEDVRILRGLDYNRDVLERHFGGLYEDVKRFAGSVVDEVMRLIREAVVGVAEELLAESDTLSGAWELLKKILGTDPFRDEEVEATPTEILEDFLLLIGQEEHLRQMQERGTVEETAEWIATQIERFRGLLGQLSSLITAAWEAIQPENLANLANNLRSLVSGIGNFLRDVMDFAWDVASEVLERIKDALLGWLADYANQIPGFHLVTVIVGRNPFTGEAVPRTAQNLIRGFITLLPGGEAVYQQLAEAGVIEGAAGRIEAAMSELGITWDFVVGVFTGIWESLSIEDLVSPLETFARIVDRFGEPISRLFAFVNVVLREVFFLLLAAMNFPVDIVESIITNVMSAIADIRNDPIGFLTNMLAAIKLGFQNFFANVLTHLAGGLADWLFRGLRGAGIEPPTDLSFQAVLDFVLEVLGITTERLWEKLAERIGQENVDRIRGAIDRLTGILEFVGDVQERGVVAIWEYVQDQLTGLWDMVIEKAREWIMERVINRAVQWLMSLLDPSGVMAVVNSVRSFIAAVQSAVEYARDILAIVADYTSTIAAVARGEVGPGAEKLEQGLANAIPVAIGFLMNQLGLGNVGEKIQEIVAGLREMVDRALTWLVDRAVSAVESVLRTLGVGGESGATEGGEVDTGEDTATDAWWDSSEPFEQADESHTLLFEGEGAEAELVVRSTKRPLQAWIERKAAELEEWRGDMTQQVYDQNVFQLGLIRQRAAEVETEKERLATVLETGSQRVVEPASRGIGRGSGEQIRRIFESIVSLIEGLTFGEQSDARPPSVLARQETETVSTGDQIGKEILAEPLSINPGGLSGSRPGGDRSNLYTQVKAVRPPRTYVQGHLLNDNLHGPGESWNLAPIPETDNKSMSSGIEETVKSAVLSQNKVASYRVQFHYGNHSAENLTPFERELPTSIEAQAFEMNVREGVSPSDEAVLNPANWVVNESKRIASFSTNTSMPSSPPNTPAETEPVGFSRLSLSDTFQGEERAAAIATLARVPGIGLRIAERVIDASITEWDDLRNVEMIGDQRFNAIKDFSEVEIDVTGRSVRRTS